MDVDVYVKIHAYLLAYVYFCVCSLWRLQLLVPVYFMFHSEVFTCVRLQRLCLVVHWCVFVIGT